MKSYSNAILNIFSIFMIPLDKGSLEQIESRGEYM